MLVRAKSTMLLDLATSFSGSDAPGSWMSFGLVAIISPIERARVGEVGAEGDRIGGGGCGADSSGPALTGTAGGLMGSAVWTAMEAMLRKEGGGGRAT